MRLILGVVLAVVLSACGGTTDEDASRDEPSATTSSSPTGSAPPEPTAAVTPSTGPASPEPSASAPTEPPASEGSVGGCGGLGALSPKQTTVGDGQGSSMRVTTVGSGATAVLLVHETEGGSCGWHPFLAEVGSDPRFRFVVPDLCGSGESTCVGEFGGDQVAQTQLLLDWIAETYRPQRVVGIGASTGGSIVVRAAGRGLPLDAAVDVSGPDRWFSDQPMSEDIRSASIPMLLVYDPGTDAEGAAVARREAGGQVRYLEMRDGHGWDALLDRRNALSGTGRTILEFAAGA